MEYHNISTITRKEITGLFIHTTVRTRFWGVMGFGVVGLIISYFYGADRIENTASLLIAMLFGFLLALVCVAAGYYISIRARVSRAMKNMGSKSYEQEILINAYGVRATVGKKTGKVNFDKLHAVHETAKAFYIFPVKDDAWIIPKAQMKDEAAESETIRTIFRKVVVSSSLKFKQ